MLLILYPFFSLKNEVFGKNSLEAVAVGSKSVEYNSSILFCSAIALYATQRHMLLAP
jgi:hypothetical protein